MELLSLYKSQIQLYFFFVKYMIVKVNLVTQRDTKKAYFTKNILNCYKF